MQGSKIRLSVSEAALFGNAEIILTKNSILQKTVALLAEVQEQISNGNLAQTFTPSPKISRGENYRGLPYVVLDYPRIANGKDLFFVRSLFWWGHFYSSTLQLSGGYKEAGRPKIETAFDGLQTYYAGSNDDPWQHHFEDNNYRRIGSLQQPEFAALLAKQSHIKIAARWPLSDWDLAANHLVESWRFYINLVS